MVAQESVRVPLRKALDKPSSPFATDSKWSLRFLKQVCSLSWCKLSSIACGLWPQRIAALLN